MDTYILLLDTTNHKVFCHAENSTIAMATVMAFTNLTMQTFIDYGPTPNFADYNNISKTFRVFNGWKVEQVGLAEEEWNQYRKNVLTRKNMHKELYQFCMYLFPFASDNIFLTENMSYLIDQLNKCDLQNNKFTDPIKTYASFTNCDNSTAYKELSLLVDGQGQRRNRLMSVYMKYRDLMNLSVITDLPNVFEQAKIEILHNSHV